MSRRPRASVPLCGHVPAVNVWLPEFGPPPGPCVLSAGHRTSGVHADSRDNRWYRDGGQQSVMVGDGPIREVLM